MGTLVGTTKTTLRKVFARAVVGVITLLAILLVLKGSATMGTDTITTLRVGFPAPWGSLTPALQHTRFADALMGNVYEPLVRNRLGRIEPEAALSWLVSNDRTKYTFKIDVERRFSNGDSLTARHFKNAWEEGLKKAPKSSNSSLSDVLYKTKGFESFQKTGVLEGVRAPANDVLEIEFAAPYRSALEDLAGNRYAAVVVQGQETLGTGAYVVEHEAEDAARFRPNPHSRHTGLFPEVAVVVAPAQDAMDLVKSGEIDVFYTFGRHWFEECEKVPNARCLSGPESAHQSLDLNGLPGRFFARPERRKALQALVWKLFSKGEGEPQTFGFSPGLRFDPQFYLPFQAGRLEESEAASMVTAPESDKKNSSVQLRRSLSSSLRDATAPPSWRPFAALACDSQPTRAKCPPKKA